MEESYKHNELTENIIGAFYTVYNQLGFGFLEKVYERALLIELKKRGLLAQAQVPIKVYYAGEVIGNYFADILVENLVIVELKAGNGLIEEHEAQLLNYLKATEIEVGLLLSFGLKAVVKRKIFTNRK